MLATGNQINYHDSYSNESVETFRGYRHTTVVGLAIVDPSQPSRSLPFIVPSRQKGRPNRPMTFQRPIYHYRLALRVPKDIIWSNISNYDPGDPLDGTIYQTGVSVDTLVGAAGSTFGTFMSVLIDPNRYNHRDEFDTQQIMQVFPGSRYMELAMKYKTSFAPQLEPQAVIDSGSLLTDSPACCPALTMDDNSPTQEGIYAPSFTIRESLHLNFSNTTAMPTTASGKKSAFILELSSFQPNRETIETEKALAGLDF